MVICNEIPVRSKWTVVNIGHGRVKDCANWHRVMKIGTDVDKDIIIPFLTCAKASGHLQCTPVSLLWILVRTLYCIHRIEQLNYSCDIWHRYRLGHNELVF